MVEGVGEGERGGMGVCVREKVGDGRECESVRESRGGRESRRWERESREGESERERDSRQWEREWEGERGGMVLCKGDRLGDGRE